MRSQIYRMLEKCSISNLFIVILILLNANIVNAGQEILIDNVNQELVAPKGKNYKWYMNGEMLFCNEQTLKIYHSGEYKVEVLDEEGNTSTEIIQVSLNKGVIRKIYIIGDSTVATYNDSYYPQMGWGQTLPLYFDNTQILFENHAIGGRSSRSFYEEGRWTTVYNLLSAGDFVFIQFGHNDRDWSKPERYTTVDSFKYFMRLYVNETRAKGAIPVLVSPMIMNAYNGTILRNVFTESGNDYRGAMLLVAHELNALFVDLNMKSYNRVKEVGKEYATYYFYLGLLAGEYPNLPDGSSDGTHFQEMGAMEMARLIIEGINELDTNADMAFLESALLPTYLVNPSMNIPGAGLVTDSCAYPSGATITLKTRTKNGFSFNHWEDDSLHVVYPNNLFMFPMGNTDTTFIASMTDCNGDTAGLASIDVCGYCAGGNSSIPPCKVVFHSENACEWDGIVLYITRDGITRRVIDTDTFSMPSIKYIVNAGKDSTYEFGIIYLSDDPDEKLDIHVNDIKAIESIEVDTTGNFQLEIVQLELEQGINTIEIASQSETGGILFDFITAYSTDISAASCSLLNTSDIFMPDLLVYPNPFTQGFIIKSAGSFEYKLFSITGIEVAQGKGQDIISLGKDLSKGMYILQVLQGENTTTRLINKR